MSPSAPCCILWLGVPSLPAAPCSRARGAAMEGGRKMEQSLLSSDLTGPPEASFASPVL